jgi:phosphatidylserine synthase
MFEDVKSIYLATRKKHDQLFNIYFMRPVAAGAVALLAPTSITPNQVTLLSLGLFVVASALLAVWTGWIGGLVGVFVLEFSYLFDCADGMLARHKKIASKEGHLFDFFTDELKAVLLCGALAVRLFGGGGRGPDLALREPGYPGFLMAGIAGVIVIGSATSLTNFIRRPELTGIETPVAAHYETVEQPGALSPVARVAWAGMTFLRFLNHYPSHLWLFALLDRLDLFLWIYIAINLLYLSRGWLGLIVRFGRT